MFTFRGWEGKYSFTSMNKVEPQTFSLLVPWWRRQHWSPWEAGSSTSRWQQCPPRPRPSRPPRPSQSSCLNPHSKQTDGQSWIKSLQWLEDDYACHIAVIRLHQYFALKSICNNYCQFNTFPRCNTTRGVMKTRFSESVWLDQPLQPVRLEQDFITSCWWALKWFR